MRIPFTGVGTALITPFTTDGSLDESAISRLARRQINAGVHVLVPCGTTGETPTLSFDERRRVIELVVAEAKGRALVLAGAGGYDTKEVIHMAAMVKAAGADGILSVTPYYNKPTPEGLYQHYKAIAESTDLPIIVYNVPGRTGCNIDPATLVRLAGIPNIIGVKEASGNISQMAEICHAVPANFIVMSGDDAITLPLMALGGHGVISVASNEVPSEMVQMVEAFERGALSDARYWHNKLLPIMQMNFLESNPGPVKFAMAAMGLCEDVFRLPMVSPQAASQEKIVRVLRDLGLPVVAGPGAGGQS
jgi:4-hydroxy-tetrahydrodipicolinate synthase